MWHGFTTGNRVITQKKAPDKRGQGWDNISAGDSLLTDAVALGVEDQAVFGREEDVQLLVRLEGVIASEQQLEVVDATALTEQIGAVT